MGFENPEPKNSSDEKEGEIITDKDRKKVFKEIAEELSKTRGNEKTPEEIERFVEGTLKTTESKILETGIKIRYEKDDGSCHFEYPPEKKSNIVSENSLEKKETIINERLVESYDVFQKELPGNYENILYPCSGEDKSPSESFSKSKVLYIDLNPRSVEILKKEGHNAYCEDAIEFCSKESNKESADIIIIMNPKISGMNLINCLKKDGYVLCNDYHGTATEFKESSDFELLGIIRKQDKKMIFDKENPEDYWKAVDSEEEFKKYPSYNTFKDIIKDIKGYEPKEVLGEYKEILRQKLDEMDEEKRAIAEQTGAIWTRDAKGNQYFLPVDMLPRKKGDQDDVFVFKKRRGKF